jgi:hypothetical protein
MLLSLVQRTKINVFVLTLRITDYGHYCNAGCPQRTAYQRIICTGLFVGYCAMAVCGTMCVSLRTGSMLKIAGVVCPVSALKGVGLRSVPTTRISGTEGV